MDRLYNNEAIVGSVILLLLNGNDMDFARLSIVVPMLINDKIRNSLFNHKDDTVAEVIKYCYADVTFSNYSANMYR